MLIRIEDLKQVCSTILAAVDNSELSKLTETLELNTEGNILYLNVTNKEYYASVKLDMGEVIDFHATVNAQLFLNLISQTTADVVELNINDQNLEIKGNGKYKLPLIFEDDKLLELPIIEINNKTTEFDIKSEILNSIAKFNSKELLKGVISKPVQRLYYVDEHGCITFTSGACVNNFTLDQPVKILLNNRLVKLFKLFKTESVHFTLGYDAITDEIIQTKVRFENDNISITAILNGDNSLVNSVPVEAIRNRANTIYDHSVTVNRLAFIEAINRLMLFTANTLKPYSKFEFIKDRVIIYDVNNSNNEEVDYQNDSNVEETYEALIDLTELKTTLDNCSDEYITIRFGNHQAIVIARNNILNVIPECHAV